MKNKVQMALAVSFVCLSLLTVPNVLPKQSVCYLTGLTGAAAAENAAYCANGLNIAPSMYLAAIDLAKAKLIVIGTPDYPYTCPDWHGTLRVCVYFSGGYRGEHVLVCCASKTVWIYLPYPSFQQIWP